MSGEAADDTKTPEELEAEAAAKAAAEGEGDEGFDVVEEGGATPASDGVPLSTFLKVKDKLKGKVRDEKRTKDAALAENELLKLQLEQANAKNRAPKSMPKALDFEGKPDEFEKATREWIGEQVREASAETLRKAAPQAETREDDDEAIKGYSDRAAKLKAADFDAAEDEVIAAVGQQAARHIISLFDNSEAVIYALGKNPKKLGELAAELRTSPAKAIVNLTRYAQGLQLKPRGKAPAPDSKEKGTTGGSDAQRQLDALREKVIQGKARMSDVVTFKKEHRGKGVTLI